jgi:putative transposase
MRRVRQGRKKSQSLEVEELERVAELPIDDGSAQLALIQALIPLGLRAVEEALIAEVNSLAGKRYEHEDGGSNVVRWGKQRGSVFIADQKLPIVVPRLRDRGENREIPLQSYERFQTPRSNDLGLYRRVVAGISCRDYEAAAEAVPEAFGVAKSSVSRRYVKASARALRSLMERRHDDQEWLVLLLDGKSFAKDQLIIALGVTVEGEKRILGIVQTATENKKVVSQFLRELGERGFASRGERFLCVVDGSKGLIAAVGDVFDGRIEIQRCQWHKRENVLSYLTKGEQPEWRRKLQAAYEHASYADAKRALDRLYRELKLRNESAARSLAEGLEETLTLHRLNVFPELGTSFKTTNLIENVMRGVEQRTRRVGRWTTSDQKLRWCASALIEVEKKFRRVRAYTKLHLLKTALQEKLRTRTLKAG